MVKLSSSTFHNLTFWEQRPLYEQKGNENYAYLVYREIGVNLKPFMNCLALHKNYDLVINCSFWNPPSKGHGNRCNSIL